MKRLDDLTHVYSRCFLESEGTKWLSAAVSNSEMIFVAMLDIDQLGKINEQYGKDIGDRMLVDISSICHSHLSRESSFVARTDDDELVILWKDCTIEEAFAQATTLFELMNSSIMIYDHYVIPVSICMGITHNYEGEIEFIDELLEVARYSLLKSKQNGRKKFNMDAGAYLP